MYVDDLFITGSFIAYIGLVKSSLHSAFSMTGLGLLKQFLGLEIEQYDAGIKVTKKKYVAGLLLKFKISECKESKCSFLSGIKLGDFGASTLVDSSLYRQLVGILLYLTHSRPDLAYDVGVVAIYM